MGLYTACEEYFRNFFLLKKTQSKYRLKEVNVETTNTKLAFPLADKPKVSIIIPFYNQIELTENCLRSILNESPSVDIEVILVDDNSTEKHDFAEVAGLHYINNSENIGFLMSVNKAINESRGEFIYLLNNDTIVHPGFLDELLYVFANFEHVGAVGSMLLNRDGTLQEAGAYFLNDGSPTQVAGKKIYDPEVNYIYEADYCSGCSLLFKKYNDEGIINLFDEQFAPAYFEDADLCFQLKHVQGKKIYFTPFSKITHLNGASYNSSADADANQNKSLLYGKQQETFRRKWHEQLKLIQAGNKKTRLQEIYGTKHILFFNERIPEYDSNSGELRLTEIIKMHKHLGYHISLIAPSNRIKNKYNEYFQRLGVRVFYDYIGIADILFFMKRLKVEQATAWLHSPRVFIKNIKFIRKYFPSLSVVFDMVDVHHLRYQRALLLEPNNNSYKRKYKRYLRYERLAAEKADLVIAISEEERKYMEQFCPKEKLYVVSNVHYTKVKPDRIPTFNERKGLLFIGSTHHPNVDAVQFLMESIMPLVWEEEPNIALNIIGNIKNSFPNHNKTNINFLGYVPDVTAHFLSNKMMVAPLRNGAGVKGKIGQAFEYYLPVITSSIGAEGMALVDNKNVLLAETAREFADNILKLYNDEGLWLNLQQHSEDSLAPFSKRALKESISKVEQAAMN